MLALELGIGTVDDYEPAPPEACTVVTVQSKYDLLRLAGQKKRAEQDAQALRTRRRRPSFLPKELERIETALKQKDAKRQQAAGSALLAARKEDDDAPQVGSAAWAGREHRGG